MHANQTVHHLMLLDVCVSQRGTMFALSPTRKEVSEWTDIFFSSFDI